MGGRDKLTETVAGMALLRLVATRALTTNASVGVALSVPGTEHRKCLSGLKVAQIDVVDADEGMAASIRTGVSHFENFDGVMILPGDMPDLLPDDFAEVLQQFNFQGGLRIIRATSSDGRQGHPVVFPRRYYADLKQLTGDVGAKSILERNSDQVIDVALAGDRALVDLDTAADWLSWQNKI